MNYKPKKSQPLIIILIILIAFAAIFYVASLNNDAELLSQTQFIEKVSNNEIESVIAQNNYIYVLKKNSEIDVDDFKSGKKYDYYLTYATSEELETLANIARTNNISYTSLPTQKSLLETLAPILYILLFVGLGIIVIKVISKNNNSAISFGKTKVNAVTTSKVRFTDVAGAEEEKKELQEIVEFLKNPKKFTEIGARIPKGVMLVGAPGTGKTLLAKAVAGESSVPFFSITGSDFVEMFVGVGASRVRDLFDRAKKHKPCIVFIDEIDAVGRQRGTGLGSQNDEREQTLNQLLTELDGFETNEGIIVMAATNRADVLDPALLRPGRFDRQIYIHMPDVKGREEIMKVHSCNKPLDSDVDFGALARLTSGFTGADIQNLLNEAAILTARENRKLIRMVDITECIGKTMMGPKKQSRVVTERDKKITAYHESGHAIIAKSIKDLKDEVEEVSIVARGAAAGYTLSRPDTDDNHVTFNYLNAQICMLMGGRVSEELILKDISTGASNDIMRATEIARNMVTEWGMSDKLGFFNFGSHGEVFIGRNYQSQNNYSDKYAAEIDEEIKRILDRNYKATKEIITSNLDKVELMSQILLEKNTIYKDEVDLIMKGSSKEEILNFMKEKEEQRKKLDEEAIKKSKQIEKQKQEAQSNNNIQNSNLKIIGVITPEELNEALNKQKKK